MAGAREAHGISERRACALLGADRSTVRYRSTRPDDSALRVRLRSLATERRRFGYRRLGLLLAREGLRPNHKKLRRLYREERLQVRRRGGRKRAIGTRAPMAMPDAANQRWSLDFASDTLADGRRFRILCVVDDFSRECLALVADTSLSGKRVARELDVVGARRGLPLTVVSDNGTELTGTAILALVAAARGRLALHRAWQAAAERVRRELHRPTARRVLERDRVHVAAACARRCWQAGSATTTRYGRTRHYGARRPARSALPPCSPGLKPAARRLRRWPPARLDPDCARRPDEPWPGWRNGARPNRETPSRSA